MDLAPPHPRSSTRQPDWLPGALLAVAHLILLGAAFILAGANGYNRNDLLLFLAEPLAALVGGLILAHQPRNPVGWLIVGHALCFTLGEFCRQYALYGVLTRPGSLPFAHALAWPAYWLWGPGLTLGLALLPLYFPDGRLTSPRWRPALWFIVAAMAFVTVSMAFQTGDAETPGVANPLGLIRNVGDNERIGAVFELLWMVAVLVGLASLMVRFRYAAPEQRRQIQWLVYALALMLAGELALPSSGLFPVLVGALLFAGVWVAIGVAVLRYRLYDIDIIINRTLVYGGLTALVIGVYIALVGYLGALFNSAGNLVIGLAATGVVAALVQPLRERLQRGVNRLLYGARDEPYTVLALLGRRLESSLAPAAVLNTIVETVVHTLKLPYAAIVAGSSELPVAVARRDENAGRDKVVSLPLAYQGELVGELRVAPRAGEAGLSPADRRLLDDLGRQIGVALSAARLTVELQHARERLVTAREEERRRLRRDFHDGLGPTLAAQTLKVGSARHFLTRDPALAERLLAELEQDIGTAIHEVRRLVHDLRPPALDDLGLDGALRLLAAQYGGEAGMGAGPRVVVEAPPDLPVLPAAVEVAVYRIAQEALTNVVRHAGARRCTIRFDVDRTGWGRPRVILEVADDGAGIGPDPRGSVGLHSMRERAAELGGSCLIQSRPEGGTLVRAELPLANGEDP